MFIYDLTNKIQSYLVIAFSTIGYMGGRKFNSFGSGTDTLCLPKEPSWTNYHEARIAPIYGTKMPQNDDGHVYIFVVN